MDKKKRGRPTTSRDVEVTPEFRKDPDIEKLGQALIAVAISIARQKEAEEAQKAQFLSDKNTEDSMT